MTLTQAQLKKQTVPQLKSLCKEKKVVGYAKLTKDALIAKLLALSDPPAAMAGISIKDTDSPSTEAHKVPDALLAQEPPTPTLETSPGRQDLVQTSEALGTDVPLQSTETSGLRGFHVTTGDSSDTSRLKNTKRKRSTAQENGEIQLEHVATNPSTEGDIGSLSCMVTHNTGTSVASSRDQNAVGNGLPSVSGAHIHGTSLPATSKRFKPLLPVRLPISTPVNLHSITRSLEPYYSFDYPAQPNLLLKPITIPVSLSQRKKLPKLSIILSMISWHDLAACSLVSKTFRYAAYLSAYHRLSREFPGRRLALIMDRYPSGATNMWPYLIQRQRTAHEWRMRYEDSFLGKALKGIKIISSALWKAPDHESQVTVALRFVLTRVYFLLSTGATLDALDTLELVVDAQEVVKGQIWRIDIRRGNTKRKLHVVEETCEVIGEIDTNHGILTTAAVPLRDDWSQYVKEQAQNDNASTKPLWDHLRWTNHEEYDKGISRLWMKRTLGEGALGTLKMEVAKRYVLACVMANGISGQWKSSQMMYQEYKGLPELLPESSKRKATRLNLFIPEHHNVESLHFTTSDGQDLHRAVAVVQTLNREYYILKDNGMQIGSEEEGIPLAWRRLIGCTVKGVAR